MPQIGFCYENLLDHVHFGRVWALKLPYADTKVSRTDAAVLPCKTSRVLGIRRNFQLRPQPSAAARKVQGWTCTQTALLMGETKCQVMGPGDHQEAGFSAIAHMLTPVTQYLDEALHNLHSRFQHILLPPQEIGHLQAIHRGHIGPRTYGETERQVTDRTPPASCPSTYRPTL